MKKFLRILLCAVALSICLGSLQVSAQSNIGDKSGTASVAEAEDIYSAIIAKKLDIAQNKSVQGFIDNYLCENVSVGSEWYALTFSQKEECDFSAYEIALDEYLDSKNIAASSSRLKYALCFAAIGSGNEYISQRLEEDILGQGIMSLVFALHLVNNGYEFSLAAKDGLRGNILDGQLDDGGWAISGSVSDVDVTAMVLQALCVNRSLPRVNDSVERAIAMLSERQLADGDFSSYGKANAQSCAQVIVALSSLGIDCAADERFIKNGRSLFDGIKKYHLDDGGFSSFADGEYSEIATIQTLYAMVSYMRMCDGKEPLYMLDRADPASLKRDVTEIENPIENLEDTKSEKKLSYKPIACAIVSGLALIGCILLVILKKKNGKNFIVIILAAMLCIAFIMVTDFKSKSDYYADGEKKTNTCGKVSITIRCDTLIGKAEGIYDAKSATILELEEFEIVEGDSVYDILIEAAKKHGIRIENDGGAVNAYIVGIEDIYEYDHGDLSGWNYRVNGEICSVGCAQYKLSDGDVIEWLYTCESGRDLE